MKRPILAIKRLIKTRPGGSGYRLMVSNLVIREGDRIALVGQSGSGKSTLLDMMAMVLMPDKMGKGGQFAWTGEGDYLDIWESWNKGDEAAREKIRRTHLGYVLQSGGLFPFLNVRDNILLSAWLKKDPRGKDLDRAVIRLVTILGIGHLLKKLPGNVSVGERQRVAVARAIIHNPSLILADEPTASLDPPTAQKVFELLLELSQGTALVLATHDEERAKKFGFKIHRIIVEDEGAGKGIKAMLFNDGRTQRY
ncbi:MAG: ABC transporter ATP-binding protein [Deltaproteobacteria bacterium]|jgi:putative ABC transport system ATP-binding protein|nr:ABC transporter ATP-binding protein [Deltaproteobacteria bacterium]